MGRESWIIKRREYMSDDSLIPMIFQAKHLYHSMYIMAADFLER